ncbi:MAG: DUF2232 domain-containing protein [Spirochaetia bacterium]|jgi:hypothetical protein|nr:DUF2232 domain-containing protein [Spirochaetia bacterium]
MELGKIPDMVKKIQKEVIIYSIISVFFYLSGYLFLFFLVPLQSLRNKKGFPALLQSCVIVISVIFFASIARTSGIPEAGTRIIIILSEVFLPLVVLTGFLYINYDWPENPRMLKKILIVTAGAFIAGIPALLIFNSGAFQNFYKNQIALALELLNRTFGELQNVEVSEMAEILKSIDVETVYAAVKKTVMRSYLFSYFVFLSGSWWFGSSGFKKGRWRSSFKPASFYLPEYMVWPLITALLIVVISFKINTGFIGDLGWNVLLIMVTMYGFRGFGIIQGMMASFKLPASLRVLIVFSIMLFLMQPGLNYIVLVGLPGLGVSEIWINYNRK